jgi:SOS response regulatory protein OraA/RecX
MDLLARRDHSELELRQKLEGHHEESEIEEAIDYIRSRNLLSPADDVAQRLIEGLERKLKSARAINQALENRGLPEMKSDAEREFRKARHLIEAKLAKTGPFDYEEQTRIHRLLAYRGFDEETIHRVINSPRKERT